MPVFATPPQSAEVVAMLCVKCFVKMEKTFNFYMEEVNRKQMPVGSTEPVWKLQQQLPGVSDTGIHCKEGVAPWIQGKLWANTGGMTGEAALAKQGAAATFLAELKWTRRKDAVHSESSAVMKPGSLECDAQ